MPTQKLTPTTISPKSTTSQGKEFVRFKAKNEQGVELDYATFDNTLFGMVAGSVIEVEVTEKQNGQYINRNVRALQKAGAGGGRPFMPRQDNPEQRASIEAQVAIKSTVELWVAGKLDDEANKAYNEAQKERVRVWLATHINA